MSDKCGYHSMMTGLHEQFGLILRHEIEETPAMFFDVAEKLLMMRDLLLLNHGDELYEGASEEVENS